MEGRSPGLKTNLTSSKATERLARSLTTPISDQKLRTRTYEELWLAVLFPSC